MGKRATTFQIFVEKVTAHKSVVNSAPIIWEKKPDLKSFSNFNNWYTYCRYSSLSDLHNFKFSNDIYLL